MIRVTNVQNDFNYAVNDKISNCHEIAQISQFHKIYKAKLEIDKFYGSGRYGIYFFIFAS